VVRSGAEPATAGAKTDGSQAKPVGITPADKAADKGPPGPKAKP
jgi:NADH-quinone oxidoreductase subunit E